MAEALLCDLASGEGPLRAVLEERERPLVLAARSCMEIRSDTGDLLRALLSHPMPVTGVVAGRISSDAAALLLACDTLLMTPRSALALQPSGRGETVLLPLRIGQAGASRVWFGAGRLTASNAARAGWATVVREGFDEALKTARGRYEGLSPAALGLLRPLLHHQAGLPLELAWALERAAFALAFDTGHPSEGVAAFLGKRAPRFPKAGG